MDLRIHPALHDAELRAFSLHASSLRHSASVRLWGGRCTKVRYYDEKHKIWDSHTYFYFLAYIFYREIDKIGYTRVVSE